MALGLVARLIEKMGASLAAARSAWGAVGVLRQGAFWSLQREPAMRLASCVGTAFSFQPAGAWRGRPTPGARVGVLVCGAAEV